MAKCSKTNCQNEGTYQPYFTFLPDGHPGAERAKAEILGIILCQDCANKSCIDDFINNKGWQQFVEGFVARGLAKPNRNSLRLGFDKEQ